MSRSKHATLAELESILDRAARLTDRQFTIFLPSNKGGILLDESIEYLKKEIIKTIDLV